jgi:16S rRNA (uracil1498-N3)-methyltransferase
MTRGPNVRVGVTGLAPGELRLEGDAAHYLARVHRLHAGEAFVAFDPAARLEAYGEIVRIDREAVVVRLGESQPARAVPANDVTLIQCAGKRDKVDDVVRSTTALGVRAVVVAESSRSVARIDGERVARRAGRWRAIALDAARQSGRGDLPDITGPRPLGGVLDELASRQAKKLCLDPCATTSFAAIFSADSSAITREIVLLVGPEGGLTDDELEHAERAGFTRVRLGPFVLRTELAGIAAVAAVLVMSS